MTDDAPVMDAPVRVMLVDDDALVRSGLQLLLGNEATIRVVAEAADGADVPAQLDLHSVDVMLMDLRMPRVDGIEATRRVLQRPEPRPRVLVLTTFDDDELVLGALQAGADGFLLKHTAPTDIIAAIHAVHAGDAVLSPSITRSLVQQVSAGSAGDAAARATTTKRLADLTDREREVADAVARGASNADIAAELHMSVATVKAHITKLFAKLGVQNRVQLALLIHDAR